MKNIKKQKGFTLIELLVVVAIIGVLSTLAIVSFNNVREKSRNSRRVADMKQISMALELYFDNNGSYPTIITPGESLTDGNITYMTLIPNNPSPRNDGSCGNNNYVYETQNNNSSYTLTFCLGKAVNNIAAGTNTMTPLGVVAVTSPPPSSCGNGIMNEGEECDDGNTSNNDSCLNNCTNAICQDGYVYTDVEECDDGDGEENDYCTNSCLFNSCGDGYVWENLGKKVEACDEASVYCISCASSSCGNGNIDNVFEECDDGNVINDDECSNRCLIKGCGDNIVQDDEECDDGNDVNNDSCNNSCQNN